tara:strand:+ start:16546 stop:18042 length:1497 start_codon:yes stop_codon:yes gene_type:complete
MKINELHNQPVQADTYEASMALNQLLKIGKHSIKIHNMIDDNAEMEAWVAKKIDLAGDYVKKVHGYIQGEKAGLYDSKMFETYVRVKKDAEGEISQYAGRLGRVVDQDDDGDYLVSWGDMEGEDWIEKKNLEFMPDDTYWNPDDEDHYKKGSDGEVATLDKEFDEDEDKDVEKAKQIAKAKAGDMTGASQDIDKMKKGLSKHPDVADALKKANEDAGEGHMSKSTLYHTAKYAIELMQMIKKGDDLEGWVQSKLNKAADYLQGVHNYEEYQKLNPYREELDANILQKHAQVVQKNIDEILARETKLDDVDTKPGMMKILAKRVNEVEKEIAKKTRDDANEGDMEQDKNNPVAKPFVNKPEWKALHDMDDKIIKAYIKHKEVKETIELEEGLKDWAKSLAMAGIFVAGLAGVGSINDAINNSVPAIQAMNNALEMAEKAGNTDLVKQIEKDLSGAKLRLDIGKDLNQVKYLQDKYSKFMPTEGLAYESKLAIMLNQHIK